MGLLLALSSGDLFDLVAAFVFSFYLFGLWGEFLFFLGRVAEVRSIDVFVVLVSYFGRG